MAELFTARSLAHAAAGSSAGCWAISLFYPLNLVRTRIQLEESGKPKGVFVSMKNIARNEGASALYVGLWSNVIVLGSSNFVYFYLYNGFRAVLLSQKRKAGNAQVISANVNLILSAVAGTINVLVTNPLWVAAMRVTIQRRTQDEGKQQEFRGVFDALCKVVHREGIPALWNGAGASLILVSNPVVQFVTYEWIKKFVEKRRRHGLHNFEFFLMGALAKAMATFVTYPFQLAQTRLRGAETQTDGHGYKGIVDCLLRTIRSDGFLGLFRGMEAKLWQTVLAAAFHFMAYEKIILAIKHIPIGRRRLKSLT